MKQTRRLRRIQRTWRNVDSGVQGLPAVDLYLVFKEILDKAEVRYEEWHTGRWGVDRKIHLSIHPDDERKGLNLLEVARWFVKATEAATAASETTV